MPSYIVLLIWGGGGGGCLPTQSTETVSCMSYDLATCQGNANLIYQIPCMYTCFVKAYFI